MESVWHFKGKNKGPTVAIIGSLHGNEKIGAEVLKKLSVELAADDIINGELYLILGNPFAYAVNKRFIDVDMNRLFGRNFEKLSRLDLESLGNEEKRVLAIAAILKNSDFLIDIHSTIKPSIPFIYCEHDERHTKLCSVFGVEYIVSPDKNFRPEDLVSSVDNFVDKSGGIGITYEAGWHKDPLKVSEVSERIKMFLSKIGVLNFDLNPGNHCSSKQLLIYDSIVPSSASFDFLKNFNNFDFVPKGAKVAVEGAVDIISSRDSYIIFPKTHIKVGEVACYLAYKK